MVLEVDGHSRPICYIFSGPKARTYHDLEPEEPTVTEATKHPTTTKTELVLNQEVEQHRTGLQRVGLQNLVLLLKLSDMMMFL